MRARQVLRIHAAAIAVALCSAAVFGQAPAVRTGSIDFVPRADEAGLPLQFQLAAHAFTFEQRPVPTSGSVMRVSKVTFPSPLVTGHPSNNVVHCEYFCPTTAGRKPAVVVLHILGGDFDLSRLFCRALAARGVAALFLKMPYYGERRQANSPARMVSIDPQDTVRGMTQAVLDIRHAASWLAAQDEIDSAGLGIMGISLGGITAALAAGMEPRFAKVCLLLAGGDMGEVAWTSTEMEPMRKRWFETGRSKEELFAALRVVDPVVYARPLPGRKVLMLNASHDEVIPPACTLALWRAFGKPEIVWWNAGHYSAIRYLGSGMVRVVRFFEPEEIPAPDAKLPTR